MAITSGFVPVAIVAGLRAVKAPVTAFRLYIETVAEAKLEA
jgi:hypothetical protein